MADTEEQIPCPWPGATINNLAPGGMGTWNKHEVDLYKNKAGWISDTFEFVTKI